MTKKEEFYRTEFNKMSFLAPIMIEIVDKLKGTDQYRLGLKRHLNGVLRELEKLTDYHFGLYENHAEDDIDGRDIYNVTAKAYDFLLSKTPVDIIHISNIVKELDRSGIKYTDKDIQFQSMIK